MLDYKEVHPNLLENRIDRAKAKLARIARCDVYNGGAKASVLAARLDRMGGDNYEDVVCEAYTAHDGNAKSYLSFECPECGQACAGEYATRECCKYEYYDNDEWDQLDDIGE